MNKLVFHQHTLFWFFLLILTLWVACAELKIEHASRQAMPRRVYQALQENFRP